MMETKDLHWLAGWLEGEGSFGLTRPKVRGIKQGGTPAMSASTTDLDTAKRVASYFGRKKFGPYFYSGEWRKDHKGIYVITLSGKKAVQWMMTLYCLMGKRRKTQIETALKRWKSIGTERRGGAAVKHYRENGLPLPL